MRSIALAALLALLVRRKVLRSGGAKAVGIPVGIPSAAPTEDVSLAFGRVLVADLTGKLSPEELAPLLDAAERTLLLNEGRGRTGARR